MLKVKGLSPAGQTPAGAVLHLDLSPFNPCSLTGWHLPHPRTPSSPPTSPLPIPVPVWVLPPEWVLAGTGE